jgi:hypothetical protein
MRALEIEHLWRKHGFTCVVALGDMGFRLGYVILPTQPTSFDADDIEVHGGVTFSGPRTAAEWREISGRRIPTGWLLGFDCGHAGDAAAPGTALSPFLTGHVWTSSEVKAEVAHLADEVKKRL